MELAFLYTDFMISNRFLRNIEVDSVQNVYKYLWGMVTDNGVARSHGSHMVISNFLQNF